MRHLLLNTFISKAIEDDRLLPSHLCLYLSLFWLWHLNGYTDHIIIFRNEVMALAKIKSIVTYHKCLRELVRHGYISYEPTYNYHQGSRIIFQ